MTLTHAPAAAQTTPEALPYAGVELGIYEKALKWNGSFDDLLTQAACAGFSFVDISIDETPRSEERV